MFSTESRLVSSDSRRARWIVGVASDNLHFTLSRILTRFSITIISFVFACVLACIGYHMRLCLGLGLRFRIWGLGSGSRVSRFGLGRSQGLGLGLGPSRAQDFGLRVGERLGVHGMALGLSVRFGGLCWGSQAMSLHLSSFGVS